MVLPESLVKFVTEEIILNSYLLIILMKLKCCFFVCFFFWGGGSGLRCRLSILRNGLVPCHYFCNPYVHFKIGLMLPVEFEKYPMSCR